MLDPYHMPRLETRPTTPADLDALGVTLPHRIRAMTALIDGEVAGVGGVMFLPGGVVGAFTHMDERIRAHRVALHRGAVRFFRDLRRDLRRPIVASADGTVEAAERWLARLGFEQTQEQDGRLWRTR